MSNERIRIFLADDNKEFCDTLINYLEKHSDLVRFYVVQNFLLFLAIALVGTITCGIGYIVGVVFWIIEIVKAFKGEKYAIPLLGGWTDKILS